MRSVLLWIVALVVPVSATAQSSSPAGETRKQEEAPRPTEGRSKAALAHLGDDARYLITFPKRPTPRGIAFTCALGGSITALVFADEGIRSEIQERRTPSLDRWERRFEPLGSIRNTTLASLAVYGAGRLIAHEATAETGRSLLEALLFTEAFDLAAKGFFGREPPGHGNTATEFFHGGSVFPSGHTAHAFAVATVLAERHGRVAAWLAYPLAAAVGLSRLERDVHWTSDVVAGAALGHLISKAVVHRRERRTSMSRSDGPRLQASWWQASASAIRILEQARRQPDGASIPK